MHAIAGETVLDSVRSMLRDTLRLRDRTVTLDPSSGLFGTIPELDSMALLSVTAAIEERFDITLKDEDITAELFETVGNLVAFIESRLAHCPHPTRSDRASGD